jgi:hypothetical protein
MKKVHCDRRRQSEPGLRKVPPPAIPGTLSAPLAIVSRGSLVWAGDTFLAHPILGHWPLSTEIAPLLRQPHFAFYSAWPRLGPVRVALVPDVDHSRLPVTRKAAVQIRLPPLAVPLFQYAGAATSRASDEIRERVVKGGQDNHMLAPVGGDQAMNGKPWVSTLHPR